MHFNRGHSTSCRLITGPFALGVLLRSWSQDLHFVILWCTETDTLNSVSALLESFIADIFIYRLHDFSKFLYKLIHAVSHNIVLIPPF